MAETVADVGEFGLIDRIHAIVEREGSRAPNLAIGIGDDTASFRARAGYEVLVTCDSMVEGRHYLPQHISPLALGRRAMAMNISDIGAMGGSPLYALISLGLRADTLVSDVEAMYRGFLFELGPFGASVIGGNITGVKGEAFIDITLIGEVEEGKAVRRSTARPGDLIVVTGHPGQAAAGLRLLRKAVSEEDLGDHPLVRAYNTPTQRAREGRAIALSGYATAMIDTSDGFLGDLGHICEESRVGALVYIEDLPLSRALRDAAKDLGVEAWEFFLGDSDDYELIVTCEGRNAGALARVIESVRGVPATAVGKISEEGSGIKVLSANGSPVVTRQGGWDHFRTVGGDRDV